MSAAMEVCLAWVQQPGNSNVLVAFFTGAVAVATILQACILSRQINHSRAVERPWVAVFAETQDRNGQPFDIMMALNNWRQLQGSDAPLLLGVDWSATNYGRSPARLVGGSVEFEFRDWPLPPTPAYTNNAPFAPMPLPHRSRPHRLRAEPFGLTPNDREPLNNGHKAVVLFGFLTYLDVLNQKHTTKFCWVWRVNDGGDLQFGANGPDAWHEYT
jgi:hypothetical protein